jgi:nitrilase
MSWPNHFPAVGRPMRDRVSVDSQAFAQMSKAFVVSACGTVDEHTIARLELSEADEAVMRDPGFCGGSVIVSPDSQVIAGPMGNEEGILYADLDLDIGIMMKLRHDFAGHYNRPDIFALRINTTQPQIFGAIDPSASAPSQPPTPQALPAPPVDGQAPLAWVDPARRAIEELTSDE